MSLWAIFWLGLLAFSAVAFVGLLVGVSGGAVRELKETLLELRHGSEQGPYEKTNGEQETFVG